MDKRDGDYLFVCVENTEGALVLYNFCAGTLYTLRGLEETVAKNTRLLYVISTGQMAILTQTGDDVMLWESDQYDSSDKIC